MIKQLVSASLVLGLSFSLTACFEKKADAPAEAPAAAPAEAAPAAAPTEAAPAAPAPAEGSH